MALSCRAAICCSTSIGKSPPLRAYSMTGFLAQSTDRPSGSPHRQNLFDLIADSLSGCSAIHSPFQEFVILGMFMPSLCDNRRGQSELLQIPAPLRLANAPASPGGGMFGDCSDFIGGAAREQDPDLFRHASNQLAVFFAPSHGLAGASSRSFIRIFRAFLLGSFQSRCLHEGALSLVTLSSPAKADNRGASRAMLRCSPRQSHVARGKKLEVAETGARQAERLLDFHQKERSLTHLRAALRAPRAALDLEYGRLW